MSVVASQLGITPPGLGELTFNNGTYNPLNGMTVSDIVALADTLISGHTSVDTTHPKPTTTKLVVNRLFADSATYANLSAVIGMIDSAFEGVVDTFSFSDSLKLKGTQVLVDVPFLRATTGEIGRASCRERV